MRDERDPRTGRNILCWNNKTRSEGMTFRRRQRDQGNRNAKRRVCQESPQRQAEEFGPDIYAPKVPTGGLNLQSKFYARTEPHNGRRHPFQMAWSKEAYVSSRLTSWRTKQIKRRGIRSR